MPCVGHRGAIIAPGESRRVLAPIGTKDLIGQEIYSAHRQISAAVFLFLLRKPQPGVSLYACTDRNNVDDELCNAPLSRILGRGRDRASINNRACTMAVITVSRHNEHFGNNLRAPVIYSDSTGVS